MHDIGTRLAELRKHKSSSPSIFTKAPLRLVVMSRMSKCRRLTFSYLLLSSITFPLMNFWAYQMMRQLLLGAKQDAEGRFEVDS